MALKTKETFDVPEQLSKIDAMDLRPYTVNWLCDDLLSVSQNNKICLSYLPEKDTLRRFTKKYDSFERVEVAFNRVKKINVFQIIRAVKNDVKKTKYRWLSNDGELKFVIKNIDGILEDFTRFPDLIEAVEAFHHYIEPIFKKQFKQKVKDYYHNVVKDELEGYMTQGDSYYRPDHFTDETVIRYYQNKYGKRFNKWWIREDVRAVDWIVQKIQESPSLVADFFKDKGYDYYGHHVYQHIYYHWTPEVLEQYKQFLKEHVDISPSEIDEDFKDFSQLIC